MLIGVGGTTRAGRAASAGRAPEPATFTTSTPSATTSEQLRIVALAVAVEAVAASFSQARFRFPKSTVNGWHDLDPRVRREDANGFFVVPFVPEASVL